MPKPRRPENRGLPARWTFQHGAYYYRVSPGLEYAWDNKRFFRLGKTLPEAYKEWARRIETLDRAANIGQLLDRYALEVVPAKAPATQKHDHAYIKKLRSVFGHMALQEIEPKDIYGYVSRRKSKSLGRKEIKLLSHAYTKAVEWGYLNKHPFKGEIRLEGELPRVRYIEDWEIVECLSLSAPRKNGSVRMIQAYIRLKMLTGMARADLLRLQVSDIKDDGIHNQRHKTRKTTGKRTIYEWTEELRNVVNEIISVRPIDISPFLFSTRRGSGYFNERTGQASGWDSMWQRFMKRVLDETAVKERFTEHDLRAKCASDAESLDHARALLSHADSKITNRVYRRKPERVKPIR